MKIIVQIDSYACIDYIFFFTVFRARSLWTIIKIARKKLAKFPYAVVYGWKKPILFFLSFVSFWCDIQCCTGCQSNARVPTKKICGWQKEMEISFKILSLSPLRHLAMCVGYVYATFFDITVFIVFFIFNVLYHTFYLLDTAFSATSTYKATFEKLKFYMDANVVNKP